MISTPTHSDPFKDERNVNGTPSDFPEKHFPLPQCNRHCQAHDLGAPQKPQVRPCNSPLSSFPHVQGVPKKPFGEGLDRDRAALTCPSSKKITIPFFSLPLLVEMLKSSWSKLEEVSLEYRKENKGKKSSISHPPMTEHRQRNTPSSPSLSRRRSSSLRDPQATTPVPMAGNTMDTKTVARTTTTTVERGATGIRSSSSSSLSATAVFHHLPLSPTLPHRNASFPTTLSSSSMENSSLRQRPTTLPHHANEHHEAASVTRLSGTKRETSVLHPKEIRDITTLRLHVQRLKEAYEGLLRIHRRQLPPFLPMPGGKEKQETPRQVATPLLPPPPLPPPTHKRTTEGKHHEPTITTTAAVPQTASTGSPRRGGGTRAVRGVVRGEASEHPSYVTHREVTLLRASLEATKCVAQEWILQAAPQTHTDVKAAADTPLYRMEGEEEGNGGGTAVRTIRRPQNGTKRPPSFYASHTVASSLTEGKAVEVALRRIETMATELEDEVGNSMLAHIMDPAFDIELPSFSPKPSLHGRERGGQERVGKAMGSRMVRYAASWYSREKKTKKENGKKKPSTATETHTRWRNLLWKTRTASPPLPPSSTQKNSIPMSPSRVDAKAHLYGSHVCIDGNTRRTLGCSPSTPSTAPWPSYWRMLVDTPWERRLQALTVGFFNFFVCCPICCLITLLMLLFGAWWIRVCLLSYLSYIFSPLGKPTFPVSSSRWYQSLPIWRYFRDYFPVRQVIPPEVQRQFNPEKNYLFGYHPHAIHAFGAAATFGGEANGLSSYLPGLKFHLQTLRINFFIPFWREMCLLIGLGDASSASIRRTLRSGPGECVVLAIGGAEESILSRPRTNDLVLKRRKGFVKMSLETGTALVPVYGFGETNTYEALHCVDHPSYFGVGQFIKRYTRLTLPGIAGRGPFRVRPLPRPIFVVFGAPIEVPQIPFPTSADIDFYHQKYMEGLLSLYNEYCGVYDVGCRGIRFLE